MAATEMNTEIRSDIDPERIGLVWMDAEQAMIARWRGEPSVERLESDVPPKRPAMGSVRRGPAGHRVAGAYPVTAPKGATASFASVPCRPCRALADLDVVEVAGRGLLHEQFADLLRRLATRRNGDVEVTTRRASRRPRSANWRLDCGKCSVQQLPRRTRGSNRGPGRQQRPRRGDSRAGQQRTWHNPKHRPLPERREIELEVEIMLANNPVPYSRH